MLSKSHQAVIFYRALYQKTNTTGCGCQLWQRSQSDTSSNKGQAKDALQKMRDYIQSKSKLQHKETNQPYDKEVAVSSRSNDLPEVKVQKHVNIDEDSQVMTFMKRNSEVAMKDCNDKTKIITFREIESEVIPKSENTEVTTFKDNDYDLAIKEDSEKSEIITFVESDHELAVRDISEKLKVTNFKKSYHELAVKAESDKTKVTNFKESDHELALKDDTEKSEVITFVESDHDLTMTDDKSEVITFIEQDHEVVVKDISERKQITTYRENDHELTVNKKEESSVMPSKKEFPPSYNMAPYVNKSELLSSLVKMRVSLAEIEKKEGAADIIIKMDLEKDLKPFLFFLKNIGVLEENLGRVITKNPYALAEDLENLKARINYLRSKNFPEDSIVAIVTRNPHVLSMSVEKIDAKLGFLQKHFKLKGNEVRSVITKCPRLITTNKDLIKDRYEYLEENLGFTKSEVKQILISCPRILITSQSLLGPTFDLLHNVMDQSHKDILRYPQIFRTRTFIIEQRHRFLVSLGRAQYDPKIENYVFLHDLVKGSDAEFCENIAKTTKDQFDAFVKTL